jgi:hypothetical protein
MLIFQIFRTIRRWIFAIFLDYLVGAKSSEKMSDSNLIR